MPPYEIEIGFQHRTVVKSWCMNFQNCAARLFIQLFYASAQGHWIAGAEVWNGIHSRQTLGCSVMGCFEEGGQCFGIRIRPIDDAENPAAAVIDDNDLQV